MELWENLFVIFCECYWNFWGIFFKFLGIFMDFFIIEFYLNLQTFFEKPTKVF